MPAIHFLCTECQSKLGVGDHKAGQTIKCPKCSLYLIVPHPRSKPRTLGIIVEDEIAGDTVPAKEADWQFDPPPSRYDDDEVYDRRPRRKKQDSGSLLAAGYICAVVSLLFFPPAFGIAGAACGIISMTRGKEGHGIAIVVMSITFAIIGMMLGAAAVR